MVMVSEDQGLVPPIWDPSSVLVFIYCTIYFIILLYLSLRSTSLEPLYPPWFPLTLLYSTWAHLFPLTLLYSTWAPLSPLIPIDLTLLHLSLFIYPPWFPLTLLYSTWSPLSPLIPLDLTLLHLSPFIPLGSPSILLDSTWPFISWTYVRKSIITTWAAVTNNTLLS